MAEQNKLEKQKIIHLIEQIPYSDEDQAQWKLNLDENGVTEELLNEMHEKFLTIAPDNFKSDWMRAKYSSDLALFKRQWRMRHASKQFKRGR